MQVYIKHNFNVQSTKSRQYSNKGCRFGDFQNIAIITI